MSTFRAGTRRIKRQGLIEPPRDIIKTTREKVIVEAMIGNTIRKKVMIITTYETINTITIYIGNRDIYCIDVQLLKDTDTNTVKTGYLTKARWDAICSIEEPFSNGTDTIIMIKLLVSYIKDNYPNVSELLFNDMSTKTCDDGNSVSLSAMKIFTDGKTWYESHFDITIDSHNKYIYDKMKETINLKKDEISFDKFAMYSNINSLDISNSELKDLYNNSKTWQIFFSKIRDLIGISKLCIWLSKNNWFDIFLNTILKINISTIQFILKIKKYNEISYKIINNIGGKYRITRKNRN
jgi:hypothetical protein